MLHDLCAMCCNSNEEFVLCFSNCSLFAEMRCIDEYSMKVLHQFVMCVGGTRVKEDVLGCIHADSLFMSCTIGHLLYRRSRRTRTAPACWSMVRSSTGRSHQLDCIVKFLQSVFK